MKAILFPTHTCQIRIAFKSVLLHCRKGYEGFICYDIQTKCCCFFLSKQKTNLLGFPLNIRVRCEFNSGYLHTAQRWYPIIKSYLKLAAARLFL